MRSPTGTPFGAIFRNEILLNFKRVAPYALMLLFSANALLWWGRGPASSRGWATNSDFFIIRLYLTFSFMTLPLFTALMMGDPVIRDFRLGIDPLIFSKPVGRAQYLLGKFFGNFFVLVCCQACFGLTLLLAQAFSLTGMIVLPVRAAPYFQHFFILVVISNLVLAAFCFTIGTLTRNVKIVYGLGVAFYPVYISWQLILKGLPPRWRLLLDPLAFNWRDELTRGQSAALLNQMTFSYDADLLLNRALVILIAFTCLTILYLRFSRAGRFEKDEDKRQTLTLDLTTETEPERLYNDAESFGVVQSTKAQIASFSNSIPVPKVKLTSEGLSASLAQLKAALNTEFRLLFAERSLIVLVPLIVLACSLDVAFFRGVPEQSYSVLYASNTANSLLLFLFGLTVFYTGEAMHRDREFRIEPLLWSAPAPNYVFLLSKFASVFLLSLALLLLVGLTAIVIQILRGQSLDEIQAYFIIYSIIPLPSIAFMAAASIALNVLLRDKYLAYAVSIALGGGLFYLVGQGFNTWLYNPVLYQIWTYADLTGAGNNSARILMHRVYFLAITTACLALAHLCFARKSTVGLRVNGRLSGTGRTLLLIIFSVAIAVTTGLLMN